VKLQESITYFLVRRTTVHTPTYGRVIES